MPVFGSATADTSVLARWLQPGAMFVWNQGLAMLVEQPEPVQDHAVSVQPRVLFALASEVPPTAGT
jgi:hypothetical protein